MEQWRLEDIRKRGSPELKAIVVWLLRGDFTKDIQLPKEEKNDESKQH